MPHAIGIRRETRSPWERRAPVTPDLVRHLVDDSGLTVLVQPSARRVFPDKEYVRAGATMTSDLSAARVILGVKEVPPAALVENTTYLMFSHVIKGQPHNMPMLARLLELDCTLIDYERITDDRGRRLISFGRFAGIAGMIDTLWALGRRWEWEGYKTPLTAVRPTVEYGSLDEAKTAIRDAGRAIGSRGLPEPLAPVVIGIAGYGNVAQGAREILSELSAREASPEELDDLDAEAPRDTVVHVTFKEHHQVVPKRSGRAFDLEEFYRNPDRYRRAFAPNLRRLTVLVNCNYWDQRYPRLVTREDLRQLFSSAAAPKLRVIGDLACDIEGGVECTVRCTDPGDPVYVWHPQTDVATSGIEGSGPVVLAVDLLPSELPREASEEFSESLARFLPILARTDYSPDFSRLKLPGELSRAAIVHRGRLTPEYRYLESHLRG